MRVKYDLEAKFSQNLRCPISQESGVSLFELLIGMAIVGIIMSIGVPSMKDMLIRSQVTAQINELSAVIQYARHNAINEQATSVICPTTNFSTCSVSWDDPKMVFTDLDDNGIRGDSEDMVAGAGNILDTFDLTGPAGSITFQGNGSVATPATLQICHEDNEAKYSRALIISLQGRVTLTEDSDDDGIHENNSGTPLSCTS